ncbi:inorganic phosphate transporter Pho88 [Phycomyces nitens]|nr:inorganic phosphate transporter Pho88 [Phycomyces nitens]
MGSPSFLSSPMFNIAFMLGSMQLAKKVDWEDPQTLFLARVGYYGAQVLVIAMSYLLITLIKKKNDTTPLRYVNQPKPSLGSPSGGAAETVETTVAEYDIGQVKQFIQSTATSILMISVMHWQFKFTQPLLLQSILPIKNLLTHKEALIHLWGDAAEGPLQRPFAAENPLGALMGALGGAAPEAAAEDNHEKKE